jgi:hypothetical protein
MAFGAFLQLGNAHKAAVVVEIRGNFHTFPRAYPRQDHPQFPNQGAICVIEIDGLRLLGIKQCGKYDPTHNQGADQPKTKKLTS